MKPDVISSREERAVESSEAAPRTVVIIRHQAHEVEVPGAKQKKKKRMELAIN